MYKSEEIVKAVKQHLLTNQNKVLWSKFAFDFLTFKYTD